MATTPTTPSTTPTSPLSQIVLHKDDLNDESLSLLNQILTNHNQLINYLLGHAGEISLNNHLNLNGKRIKGVGPATDPTDVVSQSFANSNYGAAALQPAFDALGKNVMQTYRQLSNQNQRERFSSFLNNIVNTSPTTNTSIVVFGAPSGGFVPVTITGGLHQFVDGSQEPYAAFNDSLPLATGYNISGSLSRSGGVVSGATTGANALTAGTTVAIVGSADSSFNGQFVLTSASSPNFTYNQNAPNATSAGGTITFGSVYMYLRRTGQSVLFRVGPFGADTWSNRLSGSFDGSTLVAVVTVTGSAGSDAASSAGATPPAQTGNVRIFGRL
jgi:hypothetical protein